MAAKKKGAASDVDTVAAATHQPALPDLELPEYHGRKPIGQRTSVNGAGNRITNAHEIGERVVIVLEGKVKKAGHEDTDDGLVYTEVIKVVDMFEVAGKPGSTLISTLRSAHRVATDAAGGSRAITYGGTDLGDVGYTDASGVVLTPREVAALRGDPVRAMVTDDLAPVVVVYDDASRQLWPDEYAPDQARPHIGQSILDEGVVRVVTGLLDSETGEDLAGAVVIIEHHESTTAEVPPFDADDILDDDIPAFDDAPVDDVPAIDADPEPAPTEAEATLAAGEPTDADVAFVAVSVKDLKDNLEDVTDEAELRRIVTAEKRGKNRSGALDAIYNRLESVETGVRLKLVR